jgi:hypothetical protein
LCQEECFLGYFFTQIVVWMGIPREGGCDAARGIQAVAGELPQ